MNSNITKLLFPNFMKTFFDLEKLSIKNKKKGKWREERPGSKWCLYTCILCLWVIIVAPFNHTRFIISFCYKHQVNYIKIPLAFFLTFTSQLIRLEIHFDEARWSMDRWSWSGRLVQFNLQTLDKIYQFRKEIHFKHSKPIYQSSV